MPEPTSIEDHAEDTPPRSGRAVSPHAPERPDSWRANLRHLRGNVLWLSVISLLNDTASEMIYPLLPLFLTTVLGGGPAFLGVVEGLADSTSSFFKYAGGWVSDRVHRRKALVGIGYGIATVVRPLLALATLPWHLLAVRLTDRVGKGVRNAPRDALLAESVEPAHRGLAFGFNRAFDHAGAVIGPLLATMFLLAFPGKLRPLFAFALLPGVIAVTVLVVMVRERAPQPAGAEPAPEAGLPSAEATPPADAPAGATQAPGFGRFLFVLFIFTLGNASDAFLLLRAQTFGLAVALIPLLWAVFHISKMAFSVPGGVIADRIGPRPAIVAGWLVYIAVYAGFAFASTELEVWALFIVYGVFYGLTESPEKAMVARYATAEHRATAYGAYHFAIGLGAFPASLVFGLIWQESSPEAAFLYGAALAFTAAVLLLALVPRPPRAGAQASAGA